MASNLTARKVETAKPGKYSDGGNLYLIVSETGARKWVLRFTWRGRAKEMGLGSASSVPLADAREKAASARRKIAHGLNPIDERKRDGGIPTFGEMADDVRETLSAGFRNEKHRAQWKSTLETYAASLRAKPVDTIATDDVLAVLKPIWTTKAETASRLRGRIEKVLDAAKAKGFREGENPARWRGHLDHLLPKPSKLADQFGESTPCTWICTGPNVAEHERGAGSFASRRQWQTVGAVCTVGHRRARRWVIGMRSSMDIVRYNQFA